MIIIKILMPVVLLGLMVIAVHALDSQSSPEVGFPSIASSGASEANGANATGQKQNSIVDNPIVILIPEKGTSENFYNYMIYPSVNLTPPQIVVLTWLSPRKPNINSSNYLELDKISQNVKYWRDYEPIIFQMRIPDDYKQRFVGYIVGNLTIGSKEYRVPGPNIVSYTTENIIQLENGSCSYNFDILSDNAYQICPLCKFDEGQEQIKKRMNCKNNTPGKEDLLRWLIPKEYGVPDQCSSNMVPWAW